MNEDFRIRITERNVARGVQGTADLEDVKTQGVVTNPTESLSRCMAREYVEQVEAGKTSKRKL
jgi:hypothetical protein